MSEIELQVAGIGYDGAPAGRGGERFRAAASGPASDRIYYKVSSGGGIAGAIRELFAERIGTAFLGPDERSTLGSLGVEYASEAAVRGAGMSSYVLWRLG